MNILDAMAVQGHEQVIAFQDAPSGLRGFIAIHNTTLGPAVGGTRLWTYENEAEALADALRLSRAMTYKAALAELPCGGGKAVILSHPGLKRRPAFEAFGAVVQRLRGRFFTGPDVGITDDDLAAMASTTRHVASEASLKHADISEHTAIGVWQGLRACLEFVGLERARVAIQGVGSVGMALARILKRQGMELLVADIDPRRVRQAEEELQARVVAAEEILAAPCDVLAPCGLGGVLSAETVPRIRVRIVCGSANNVLAAPEVADELARRGILYAPDYLVNAGGLIRGVEHDLLKIPDSGASLARIYNRMRRVLEVSNQRGLSTAQVADELAEARWRQNVA